MQKLYCYVDETGQDPASRFFIVVTVVSDQEQDALRVRLLDAEKTAETNHLKWHKTVHSRRMKYLSLVLERKIASGGVYIASYRKPIPYFFPMVVVVEKAIKRAAKGQYRARVYVDGIDRQKAKELTNALRASKVSLQMVKGRRDESEPVIRLADMWAGCIRSAFLKHEDTGALFSKAKEQGYLTDLTAA